jgi:hypothetical protein
MKKVISICLLSLVTSFAWASNTDVKLNITADGKPQPFTFKDASSLSIGGTPGVLQKIIIHANFYAPDSKTQRADPLKFMCNSLEYTVRAGDTVLCERDGGAAVLATLSLTEADWFNGASGTITIQ